VHRLQDPHATPAERSLAAREIQAGACASGP
jgi:hypothetical protein